MNAKKSTGSGRVAFDDRGRAVWEWRTDAEEFSREIDTKRLKTLQSDELALITTGSHAKPAAGFDPYNSRGMNGASAEKRRSLDDLRQLSEQIKRSRDHSK